MRRRAASLTLNVRLDMRNTWLILLTSFLFFASAAVQASGGTGEYNLPWGFRGEAIFYHSCGMADYCWVAEVRTLKDRRAIASLHCDGEQLLYRLAEKSEEQVLSATCEEANTLDKPKQIRAVLMRILKRSK